MSSILVIEDNATNMKLAAVILDSSGYTVLESSDARQGIDLAREHQPDLILMDIQLPGIDGLTATRMLKQDPLTKHIKIIALTAFAMKGDEERILAAGCDAYIPKPLRHKEFLETIGQVLESSVR
ncbi:MAG TPA: response regulator [Rhodocyclaceae bacterium]|jgi:two-component system cell cycle response regulator DivK|nr:response regulator [Rhodocyclaceae bacterium]